MVNTSAAIYLRISLDREGDEKAIARQREDAEEVAQRRGWTITETYTDNSISASKADTVRPAYEKMRRDYKSGHFSAIICYDLDRLTRQPRQLEDWIDEAERNGLVITTLNGEADLGTDAGRLFARIKAAVSRSEVERKSARQKRANRQRAEAGAWQFSRRPYGYRRDNGHIEIVPDEADVIREAYARYLTGASYYEITKDWNARGIMTTNGAQWSMRMIRQTLRNPRYAGIVKHNGNVIDALPEWEPIIDRATWDNYVGTREGRTRKGSWSTSTKHLLSGLLTCGVCGGRMLARPDHGRRVYSCCEKWCTTVRAEALDDFIGQLVIARLGDPQLVAALRETPDTAPIESQLNDLRRKRDDVLDLLADGLLDRAKARVKAEHLTAQIDAATSRLRALRSESPLTDLALAESIPARWGQLSILDQRRVIDEIGLKITVNRGRRGRLPLDAEGQPMLDVDRLGIDWKE